MRRERENISLQNLLALFLILTIFRATAAWAAITIDCSNPGPNPVNERSGMQCNISATTGETPQVAAGTDTCGGSVSGSAPWTYDFTPTETEAQGPGSCVAAVEAVGDPTNNDSGIITINDVSLIWYVDLNAAGDSTGFSWEDAFVNVQDAVDAASSGDMIWVAGGTYKSTSATDPVVKMKDGVKIYGGFAGSESELSSRADPSDNPSTLDGENTSFNVVVGASNATLDGFTITNGNASAADSVGGGMINIDVADLTVSKCRFINNSANLLGGGMLNYISTNLMITNCIFSGNQAGKDGGGIYNYASSYTITNCTLNKNSATNGNGGGIFNYGYSTTIPLKITNSILWGDSASSVQEIYNTTNANLTITYSDVKGGPSSVNGNINSDPLFSNAIAGDLHLKSGSPCIDSGTSQGAPNDDIVGSHRPSGCAYDMGAYEYLSVCKENSVPQFWLDFGDQRILVYLTALDTKDIDHYEIYYSDKKSDIDPEPTSGSVLPLSDFTPGRVKRIIISTDLKNDAPLQNGVRYYVRVRAFDKSGNAGTLSGIKSIVPQKTTSLTGAKKDSGSCSALPPGVNPNPRDAFVLWSVWAIVAIILRRHLKGLKQIK